MFKNIIMYNVTFNDQTSSLSSYQFLKTAWKQMSVTNKLQLTSSYWHVRSSYSHEVNKLQYKFGNHRVY